MTCNHLMSDVFVKGVRCLFGIGKEVSLEDMFVVWVSDIGAFFVNNEEVDHRRIVLVVSVITMHFYTDAFFIFCFSVSRIEGDTLQADAQPMERQVDPQYSYSLSLVVVNGQYIRGQWHGGVVSLEEGSCPIAFIGLHSLDKPVGLEVVVGGITNGGGLHLPQAVPHGIGTEPMSLFRVVIVDKAEAAAADARILFNHVCHDVIQLVRAVKAGFYFRHPVNGCHRYFLHGGSHLLALAVEDGHAEDAASADG